MLLKEYEAATEKLASLALSIATAKRPDYTIGHNDVLKNFKRTSERTGTSPLQVWLTFFLKHVDAVSSYCGGAINPSEPIEARFADLMNYLFLGYALICEAQEEAKHLGRTDLKLMPKGYIPVGESILFNSLILQKRRNAYLDPSVHGPVGHPIVEDPAITYARQTMNSLRGAE